MDKFLENLGFIGKTIYYGVLFMLFIAYPVYVLWMVFNGLPSKIGAPILYLSFLGSIYHAYWLIESKFESKLRSGVPEDDVTKYYRGLVLSVLLMILGVSFLILGKVYFPHDFF